MKGLLCAFRRLTVRSFHLADIRFFLTSPVSGFSHRLLTAVLVMALLWAQSLGLWHSAVHVVHSQHDHASAQPGPDVARTRGASAWERLFSSHEDAADCLFFDQLSHGDAVTLAISHSVPLEALPAVLPHGPVLWVARWFSQFQARGPPVFR